MAATCIPLTQILSSAVYLKTTNQYKSQSLFKKNLHFLPNLRRRFCPPTPFLRREKFKFSLDAKHAGSEKKVGHHGNGEEKKGRGEEENYELKALETVLNMYTEIKKGNKNGIAEEIGDERQCFSNFLPTFRIGGKKVLAFFYRLMTTLGNNIKLVVHPTLTEKSAVGLKWRLECAEPPIVLGKGFGIRIYHIHQGKLLIRSVQFQKKLKMLMEPILHLEHLRLRIIASAVSLAEKISAYMRPAESIRKQAANVVLLLSLLVFALAIVLFSKPGFD